MRLLNFEFGDRVEVRGTNITGTIIRTGGMFAVIETITEGKRLPLRIELNRLRHLDAFGMRIVHRGKKKLKKWISRR